MIARAFGVAVTLLVSMSMLSSLCIDAVSAQSASDITYSVTANGIEIHSANTTTLISNTFPAATVRAGNLTNLTGDGFLLRSIVGYNTSSTNGFSPGLIKYLAPSNRSTWAVAGPQESTTSEGSKVTVTLRATLDMMYVGGTGGGPSGPGGNGPMSSVQGWAQVTVSFTASDFRYSSTYSGVGSSPAYSVNGSSEVKFDVSMVILKPLPVDSIALEFALMKMDDATYMPSTTSGQYRFMNYEGGGMTTVSDPYVNETQGSAELIHNFTSREQFKQIIDFVNNSGVTDGFFSWAEQAKTRTTAGANLSDVSAFYRTDGESLTVFLSTPLTADTLTVDHDPSLGVFGGGAIVPINIPGAGALSAAVMSVLIGVAIGAVVGGAGIYTVISRRDDEDPADSVLLEKNRYYRKGE